jgi:hypothetical protein
MRLLHLVRILLQDSALFPLKMMASLMPVEVRQIWFNTLEARLAFELVGAGFSRVVPHGKVLGIADENGPDGPVTVYTENGAVTVERTKVAAALILFCKRHHIPLPAAAKKTVRVDGDRLMLRVFLSDADPEAETAASKPIALNAWTRQLTKTER